MKLYYAAGPPTTMNLNGTVTVQEGDSVNIACFSYGNPVPTISWYLGTSPAPFPQSDSVQDFSAVIIGSRQLIFTESNITSVLQITNAIYPAHDGEYTCVGLNSHREVDNASNATITVQVQGRGGERGGEGEGGKVGRWGGGRKRGERGEGREGGRGERGEEKEGGGERGGRREEGSMI